MRGPFTVSVNAVQASDLTFLAMDRSRLGPGLAFTHTLRPLPTFLIVQNGSLFSAVLVRGFPEKMDAPLPMVAGASSTIFEHDGET